MKIFSRFLLFMALFSVCASSGIAQTDQAEITLWESVKDSKGRAEFEAFLESFPNSKFAPLAKVRLKKLSPPPTSQDGFDDELDTSDATTSHQNSTGASTPHECDQYAAHTHDPRRVTKGVSNDVLKSHAQGAIIVCREALKQFPNEARFQYQLGRALLQFGKANEAASWIKKAANAKYRMAIYEMAKMLSAGEGVSRNEKITFKWAQRAAELGNAPAMRTVGEAYLNGNGVPQNSEQAQEWLHKSARAGETESWNDLGDMYSYGQGVEKDERQATIYYMKSADAGNFRGMSKMALRFDKGWGVGVDRKKAVELYLHALKNGDGWARMMLIFNPSNPKEYPMLVSTEARRMIQERLKMLGYYQGRTDGNFGSATLTALKRFAKEDANRRASNAAKQSAKNSIVQEPKPSTSEAISADQAEDLKDLERLD